MKTDFIHQFPLAKYAAGTKLLTDPLPKQVFLYLKSGCVQMSHTDEEGREVKLHIFYPGACVSLLSLVDSGELYDFVALTEVEAYRIPREALLRELHRDTELTFYFLAHALKGMNGLLFRIQHAASASAYQRVASVLTYFARHSETDTLLHSLTHQEISEWLGLTRENVSIQMKKLERAGLITKKADRIVILDFARLQKLSQAVSM